MSCAHGRVVPVSKSVKEPDGPTLWRCVDCGQRGAEVGLDDGDE